MITSETLYKKYPHPYLRDQYDNRDCVSLCVHPLSLRGNHRKVVRDDPGIYKKMNYIISDYFHEFLKVSVSN